MPGKKAYPASSLFMGSFLLFIRFYGYLEFPFMIYNGNMLFIAAELTVQSPGYRMPWLKGDPVGFDVLYKARSVR